MSDLSYKKGDTVKLHTGEECTVVDVVVDEKGVERVRVGSDNWTQDCWVDPSRLEA